MDGQSVSLSIVLSASDIELIERAAVRVGGSPAEFVRYAALRMAAQDAQLPSRAHPRHEDQPSNYPSRRSLRQRIERATMPTTVVVRQLKTHLGVQLLAITVGASADQVKRWTSEESEPSPTHERRLREAHEAWQLVVSVESPKTARAWWMGMKDQLDDLSPAEAIALDQADTVMSVARDFLETG